MAAHLKKVKTEMLDYKLWLDNSEDLLAIMNQVQGYNNNILEIDEIVDNTCSTLHGIRKYHKFTFKEESINCYLTSEDKDPSKSVYQSILE
jgi:hypothetical protein